MAVPSGAAKAWVDQAAVRPVPVRSRVEATTRAPGAAPDTRSARPGTTWKSLNIGTPTCCQMAMPGLSPTSLKPPSEAGPSASGRPAPSPHWPSQSQSRVETSIRKAGSTRASVISEGSGEAWITGSAPGGAKASSETTSSSGSKISTSPTRREASTSWAVASSVARWKAASTSSAPAPPSMPKGLETTGRPDQ